MAVTATRMYDIYVISDKERRAEGGQSTRQYTYDESEANVISRLTTLINAIPTGEHLQSVSILRKIKYVEETPGT